jgi:N-acetyl-anhydromuramyl-L-alanine amidase AmpD
MKNKYKQMKKRWKLLAVVAVITVAMYLYWPNRWNYIVIHLSAGNYGNIEHLQKIHNQRQSKEPINAISYHYIIGNGNGMPDGDIASDKRKEYNLWGVHVSGNNFDKNLRGLGICVIGNLENREMTPKQYQSLLKLTVKLAKEHNIDINNIQAHGKIEGESTKCPGKKFPFKRFKKDLNKLLTNTDSD